MRTAAAIVRALTIDSLALSAALVYAGCDSRSASSGPQTQPQTPEPKDVGAKEATPGADEPEKKVESDAQRVVAVGDVHGDLEAARKALRIAGVLEGDSKWIGGDTILVQTGDQLDRGDDEPEILSLLLTLTEQAAKAGGKVHVLNGNHEIMNAMGDLRYVTKDGFADYEGVNNGAVDADALSEAPEFAHGRISAFAPGGAAREILAARDVAVVVERTVFVHGGLLPEYAKDLETINKQTKQWLAGKRDQPPMAVVAQDGPVWSRHYSDKPDASDCALLEETLEALDVDRMVVGHTVQPDVTSACDGKVWMIDVGMAAHYGGKPAALEIRGDQVTVLR